MAEKFDKDRAEYNLTELKLNHKFALKMASIVSWAVVSAISIIGVFAGATTPMALSVLGAMVVIFGIVTFAGTRSAALA
jgi:hypothetical protein